MYGKLKLLAGFFFGIRCQKEKIKYLEADNNYEIIYKGKAKFGDDEDDNVNKAIKSLEEKLKDRNILI